MSEQVWDVGLSRLQIKNGKPSTMQVVIPAAIARGLFAAGYNRTKIRITDEGLLLTPYHSDEIRDSRHVSAVTLPDWNAA